MSQYGVHLGRANGELTPTQNPWQSRKCQYFVHSPTRKVAVTSIAEAMPMGRLWYPASNQRPMGKPNMNMKAYWTEPIHALFLEGQFSERTGFTISAAYMSDGE